MTTSQTRTRVAVLGAGGIGTAAHLPSITGLVDKAELVAVVEPDPEKRRLAQERFAVGAVYERADEMLDDVRPELVMVATPPYTHADLVVQVLESGAWAFCEKPLCGSLRDADRIIEAEQRTGQWCVTVSQFRYAGGSRQVSATLREGTWGRPLLGVAHTAWYRGPEYWTVPWRGKIGTEFGGSTTTQAHHAIDLMLWLMGEWESVSAYTGTIARQIEVEDTSVGAVRFRSGAMGTVLATIASHHQHTRVAVHAEHASVELNTLYRPLLGEWSVVQTRPDGTSATVDRWAGPEEPEVEHQHQAQLSRIIDAHRTGRKPELTGVEARSMLEFLTAYYKSAATGRAVVAGEIEPNDPFYDALSGPAVLPVGSAK